jgi:predicted Fe-Mo cluster-binding NifX family protein
MSVGFLLPSADDAVIWRGPRKYGLIRQFLQLVDWGDLDYLVIDAPPGTGDEPMAVAELAQPRASALLVTTPQELAISDVRRSVMFCRQVSLPVAGIVENMSGLECPDCGCHIDLFGSGGGERLAASTGVPFLGRIPIDPAIVVRGDQGVSFTDPAAEGPAQTAFAEVVSAILARGGGLANPEQDHAQTSEEDVMQIAIPLANGRLTEHFGHCQEFALITVDPQHKKILDNQRLEPPPHEPGVLPRWLAEQGAKLIIAGGMGGRAREMFQANGIEVVLGAPALDPQELVISYLEGSLEGGSNPCDHDHSAHGCQHHG